MATVEIRKVTKKFGEFVAVRDADLSVDAGEVVCLLGPSGCGKTTTLRMIAGLERVTSGDVVIAGQRVNDLPPEKRDIAMVFQFYALYPALTVAENIAMPLHNERLARAEKAARVARVADILHLGAILDRLPDQISEGEKQRVAVARAIVRDPNCFLFDEPLSRLDVELRESMRGQIKAVLSGLSKATVIVTHDQLEALTMADRIAIMRDGLIEQVGSPHEVFARPANLFVASFIGTPQMNLLEAELTGYGDGKATVVLDEREVELMVNPAVARLRPGRVTVGIRPRAFSAVPEHTSGAIETVAELIEPMGAETLIHARSRTGSDIRVVIPRELKVSPGEALHLVPDPVQTHVFADDGKAIRA
ncbi:multiple sugar transport system ATP-binding protein/multiple sugar transport system ATP-binding protein [Tistlia consotensis]|uniref:Multiple sugar transport system ATP-binding protein/multiple sugar transport system ATP-binding protein n=1 Tax=Tistlia consotensis USBA 355 TaxID=560819 RepID=A0A1Y6CRF4_9PROT|nr:ABC transporter ATP-binding protein [Tistlia consotensis]SMF73642.1 multiple sugar transport system ATP-binding protein/multiple sugar transport system ATP-binding protein [Tistlia consotensis USBA 355]SNS28337.1 multiple sugar transport system ATP-binding protein/multiple sugar transport system ATP-binding protein [Tistlia consotensis]